MQSYKIETRTADTKKTVLITGGAGFIGGNFTNYTVKNYPDYKIIVLDKLTYAGNLETLEGIKDKIVFIRADIADRAAVYEVFEKHKPNFVVNFAAESHVDRSIANPEIFLKTNILGTQILMDACLKYKAERFHQISTDEVYGDLPLDMPHLTFSESTPLRASSPYSASKASADLLVSAYCRTYKFNATVSRCSNNYGAYQFPEKLIPIIILNALSGNTVPIYGNGKNVRDWIYADDHCRAVDLIIHNGKSGNVYNIGSNAEMSNTDLAKTVLKIMGKPESLIKYVEDRKGHDLRYAVDSSKLKKELGWKPLVDFDSGIRKTVEWYLDNINWCKSVLNKNKNELYNKINAEF